MAPRIAEQVSAPPVKYAGGPLRVFRLATGPDGRVYGSTTRPLRMFRLDGDTITDQGKLGAGQASVLYAHRGELLVGAYAATARLFRMRPASSEFVPVHFNGEDETWRPTAMAGAPGGHVYIAALPGYGRVSGPLYRWDVAGGVVSQLDLPFAGESPIALAAVGEFIVVGTTIRPGVGAKSVAHNARVVVLDARSGRKLYDIVPFPGVTAITSLVATPDGRVWGTAVPNRIFSVDLSSRDVRLCTPQSFVAGDENLDNNLMVTEDGSIWGICSGGVFTVSRTSVTATLLAPASAPVTAGLAANGRRLYFACDSEIYAFDRP
jgi:hypothetical protein